jgi:hypothetical protein
MVTAFGRYFGRRGTVTRMVTEKSVALELDGFGHTVIGADCLTVCLMPNPETVPAPRGWDHV